MSAPGNDRGYTGAATRTRVVGDSTITYRELGRPGGIPLVVLVHLGANLDNWDPRVMDGLAETRHVIAVGYQGVGSSTGAVRDSIEAMADDVIAFVEALGTDQIDILGLSMGGMVAQAIVSRRPQMVDRLILASTGPAGGPGLTAMTKVTVRTTLRAMARFTDPKTLLFFTRSSSGRNAAKEYLARLAERVADREKPVIPAVFAAQLRAVHRWGGQSASDRDAFTGPVLLVHGEDDLMVPVTNAADLQRRLPQATLKIYPHAGHGAVFQNHADFVTTATAFLRRTVTPDP
ncbi:alpha/beta hydrolase [Brooklawnia cerclae]|uniref:Pimeloyl-ACP methyl ester carboxylesterase n=1 Tax=Brooklawnia cerclae TaxID=349934 RepID=A0ABX0SEG5_9ACTN|nr:alpha/beta hydrolase [Brooklawnia cerclae]NIH56793.1 pimeloyl-ACP methyl ester carboxylesterase [Brooklawnia cerclae]